MPSKKTWRQRLTKTQEFIEAQNSVPGNQWVDDFLDFYLQHYLSDQEKQAISEAMAQAKSANKPNSETDRSYRRALILIKVSQTGLQNYEITQAKTEVNRLTANFATKYQDEVGSLSSSFKSKLDYSSSSSDVRYLISWIQQREQGFYTLGKKQGDTYGTYGVKKYVSGMPDALKYRVGFAWVLESKKRRSDYLEDAKALLLLRLMQGQAFSEALVELRSTKDSDLKNKLAHWLKRVRKDTMTFDLDHLASDLSDVTALLQDVRHKYDSTETPYRFEYTPNPQAPEQVKVVNSDTNQVHLIFNSGKSGSPPDLRKDKKADGPDAEELISLGRKVIWIVRSLCPKGTFNNRLKPITDHSDEKPFWYAYDRALHYKKEQSYAGFKPILFQLIWNLEDSPGWWNQYAEATWEWLKKPHDDLQKAQRAKEERERGDKKRLELDVANLLRKRRIAPPKIDFARDMAAKGMASYLSGGGVCAQLSHLTLGVLTLLAPPGTTIAQVYHSIDHSFVVVTKGDATWFTVDPWAGDAYVCPWEESAFPPGGAALDRVANHFQVQVERPVDIPYGVTFNTQHRTLAQQLANSSIASKPAFKLKQAYEPSEALKLAQKGVLPDKVWTHLNGLSRNKESALLWKRGALLVALPEEWGNGAINAVQQRLVQARQTLQALSGQQSIAHSLANHMDDWQSGDDDDESGNGLAPSPTLLNGMKIIFDQAVPVSPVSLIPKAKPSRHGSHA
ncbi:MAG: hypothetical protein AAFV72_18565 [Cyanobacteria bacterium J06635_1]